MRLGDDEVRDRAQAGGLGIEVIPQGSALAVLLSAQENVALPLLARGCPPTTPAPGRSRPGAVGSRSRAATSPRS